ncbi:MAG: GNAT family N-acetyltransferase [Candidatus Sericytochromatia bacterium]|nr:GNAT family N-acetyltransferase [Candidatus Sericytochromatia bacterium]
MALPLIRSARQSDWMALWPLVQDATDATAASSPEAFRARYQHLVQSAEHRLLVAENSEALLGYAWAQQLGLDLRSGATLAIFHDLYLSPRARQKGLGKRLFEAICGWARQAGVQRLSWQAQPEAEGFYHHLGLAATARAYNLNPQDLSTLRTQAHKESA